MNFGDVFSRAWKTIWNNKVLWLFGLMASLMGRWPSNQNNYRYEVPGNLADLPMGWQNWGNGFQQMIDSWSGFTNAAMILLLVVVACVAVIAFTFLSIVGQGALVKGIWKYNEDSSRKLRFGELFKDGLHYFWKLFALGLLVFAGGIGLAIVVVVLSVVTLGIGAVIFCCLAIPLAIGFAMLLRQTVISIVAEDREIFAAIKHSWNFVIQQHLGNYLLMFLIVGVGGIVVNFVIALPFAAMALPMLGSLAFGGDAVVTGGVMVSIILALIYLPFYLILSGGLQAFSYSVWTIFYRDLRDAHDEASLSPVELEASIPDDGNME